MDDDPVDRFGDSIGNADYANPPGGLLFPMLLWLVVVAFAALVVWGAAWVVNAEGSVATVVRPVNVPRQLAYTLKPALRFAPDCEYWLDGKRVESAADFPAGSSVRLTYDRNTRIISKAYAISPREQ